jgi:RNA polymerase sigma-70 factor, ECF subfamily
MLASQLAMKAQPRVTDSSAAQDVDLIRAVARKDRRAFEALYYKYSSRIGRFLFKMLSQRDMVDEVINDVMLVVWQSAERFNPDASALSTWLFGIAHNKALKALSRNRRHASDVSLDTVQADTDIDIDSQDARELPSPDSPERALMGRQIGEALAWALERLSPDHRAVVELAFGEDFSYQEIANIIDCPVNTVKTRVFYARKRLGELLTERGVRQGAQA